MYGKEILKSDEIQQFASIVNSSNYNISKDCIPQANINLLLNEDLAIYQKMVGSLLGLSIGDALGGPYEFEGREIRNLKPVTEMIGGGVHKLIKGEWTDDTTLALCLAVSLICKGTCHQYDQLMRYNWWRDNGYFSSRQICFDIGNMTGGALREFKRRKQLLFFAIRHSPHGSDDDILITDEVLKTFDISMRCGGTCQNQKAGNGSLMRLAPIPIFFFNFKEEGLAAAQDSCVTTHDDPEAIEACLLYTALIMGAIEGLDKEVILGSGFYENYTKSSLKSEKIIDIANGSYKVKEDKDINGNGYVVNSLKAALWSFYNDNNSFETGVFLAINLGDDTDTTAAIYGQLAGAFYGIDGIPEIWRKDLVHSKQIINIAEWLFVCNQDKRNRKNNMAV